MCHKVLIQVKTISIVKKPSSGIFVTAKSGEQQIKRVLILQARFFTEHILLYHSFSGSRKWGGIYLSFSWTFSWHSTCHVHKVRSSISVTLKFVFKRLIDGAGKSFVHQLGLHAISFFHLFSWSIHDLFPLLLYVTFDQLHIPHGFRKLSWGMRFYCYTRLQCNEDNIDGNGIHKSVLICSLLWLHNNFYCLSHFVYINICLSLPFAACYSIFTLKALVFFRSASGISTTALSTLQWACCILDF